MNLFSRWRLRSRKRRELLENKGLHFGTNKDRMVSIFRFLDIPDQHSDLSFRFKENDNIYLFRGSLSNVEDNGVNVCRDVGPLTPHEEVNKEYYYSFDQIAMNSIAQYDINKEEFVNMDAELKTSEALDFNDECEAIENLLLNIKEQDFDTETLFKNWTIKDIIAHLHLWNIAADQTLNDPEKFQEFIAMAMGGLMKGGSHQALQDEYFGEKSGFEIFQEWQDYYPEMARRFALADPDKRVKWAGPDMSVKSCIIARQMEHWAHAQAIFDVLGVDRVNGDRLKNVAHIGVTTYSWSFKVNGREPLKPKPYVRLTAPSGAIWEWNEPQDDNKVEGYATEFSQVVTQCRNIEDTSLQMTGHAANEWMAIAQCFAGGKETPPPKGARRKV